MRRLPEPRFIKPETVDIGDTIRVTDNSLSRTDGIERSAVGKVARRDDHGNVRAYFTAEGGRLLTWEPGKPHPRITLLDRDPVTEEPTLFEYSSVGERHEPGLSYNVGQ